MFRIEFQNRRIIILELTSWLPASSIVFITFPVDQKLEGLFALGDLEARVDDEFDLKLVSPEFGLAGSGRGGAYLL